MVDSSSFVSTIPFDISVLISPDQSRYFSAGKNILNVIVSITQPRTVFDVSGGIYAESFVADNAGSLL